MDGTEIALRVVGAFYTFAGLVAARAALTSNLIDQAISAISLKKPDRIDTQRTLWLVGLSTLVFAGGVCLMLLLVPAAWIFGAGTLAQALYFTVLGPFHFDVADLPDPAGRRRSVNAFAMYCAATAFVVWAAYSGRLIPLGNASGLLLGAAAIAVALHVGYIVRHLAMPPRRTRAFAGFDGSDEADETDHTGADVSNSRRIKVMTDYNCYPLWAMDEGKVGPFAPNHLGASLELENDLWAWAGEFDMSLDSDDPASSRWSEERRREHIEAGIALARRIKRELPDREVFVHDANGELVEVTVKDDSAVR